MRDAPRRSRLARLKRPAPLFLAAAAASSLAGCVALSVVLAPAPIVIATGEPGGIYHPVGNTICRLVNLAEKAATGPCLAVASEGSLANLQLIRSGRANLGLAQSDVADAAFRGEGPFASAAPDATLRVLIALHAESFTVLARPDSGMRDFQDLRGRRVGLGTSGAGHAVTRDLVLGHFGWTISDFDRLLELGPAEQNRTLCGGGVDAIVLLAGHPNGLTQEATTECGARLVRIAGPAVDRLLAAQRSFFRSVIPGGLYAGAPQDVPTFGTRALLLASARLPDEAAYDLTKAVLENFDDFRLLHPVLFALKPESLVPTGAVVPVHPGALRYYRETRLGG
jgi:uncharacterized protein